MKYTLSFLLLLALFACEGEPKTEYVEKYEVPITEEEMPAPDSLLRHVVLFSFKPEATDENIREVENAFRELPSLIPAIYHFEWGTNNSPEGLDKGFTHSFLVTFLSEEDRATYLPHPDHQAFVEVLGPYLEDVLVIDYWTRE